MKNEKDRLASLLVQKYQLDQAGSQVAMLNDTLNIMQTKLQDNEESLNDMLKIMESLLEQHSINSDEINYEFYDEEILFVNEHAVELPSNQLSLIQSIDFDCSMDWETYIKSVELFAEKNNINLNDDPFQHLMTNTQRIQLEKRIKEEFTLKNAQCDKYDYMIAGTCGLIGGLIDIIFVGLPNDSILTNFTDKLVDKSVQQFASFNGWKGPKEGHDPTKSAIGFLEKNFKVNYDHRYGGDVNHKFNMSTKNHHLKSLAHSPDLVGLFFSILDQLTDTAHFIDNGKIISIDTDTFELKGSNLISKIFSGFVNWLGHLFSDVSGSSGATGRGSGIPIPFYSLLQLINFGEFDVKGSDKKVYRNTFSQISIRVFEQGYDFRHGVSLTIPVIITELFTRIMWIFKKRFYHKHSWNECLFSENNPELRRMLLISHGSLCLVDAADAGIRSGGEIVQFLLRTNIVAWFRFSTLALKELNSWYNNNSLDHDAIDNYLQSEYKRILNSK